MAKIWFVRTTLLDGKIFEEAATGVDNAGKVDAKGKAEAVFTQGYAVEKPATGVFTAYPLSQIKSVGIYFVEGS